MTNCPLCKEALKPEEGQLIWHGDDCRIMIVNDPDLPGFCRVIWNHHVTEMSDLTQGQREHLMTLVYAVEEAIRQVMHPDKVNLAALGNMVPHIHWHVIPRYQDDVFFPASVWSNKTQETPKSVLESRKNLVKDLPAAIKAAVAALH